MPAMHAFRGMIRCAIRSRKVLGQCGQVVQPSKLSSLGAIAPAFGAATDKLI